MFKFIILPLLAVVMGLKILGYLQSSFWILLSPFLIYLIGLLIWWYINNDSNPF